MLQDLEDRRVSKAYQEPRAQQVLKGYRAHKDSKEIRDRREFKALRENQVRTSI
jgi:hypothetical protein